MLIFSHIRFNIRHRIIKKIGNEIKYVKKAKPYYIAEAETLADAINLLDDRIKLIEELIDTKIKKAIYDLIKANPTLVNPYDSNTSNA